MKKRLYVALVAASLISSEGKAAEALGRLFFTPEQRAALDAGKLAGGKRSSTPAVHIPRSVTLNGVVTRSDGESTVWVNGRTLHERSTGIRATASASDSTAARLKVGAARKPVRIRVGQRIDLRTGNIAEPYEHAAAGRGTAMPTVTPSASGADKKQQDVEPESTSDN